MVLSIKLSLFLPTIATSIVVALKGDRGKMEILLLSPLRVGRAITLEREIKIFQIIIFVTQT